MVRVHHFSHRYAPGEGRHESAKDSLTYHAALLLEWSHRRHGTLLELAWWNGASGYAGKSNWFRDRDAPPTSPTSTPSSSTSSSSSASSSSEGEASDGWKTPATPYETSLHRALPDALKSPWDDRRAEVRAYDVPYRDGAELMAYLEGYAGHSKRFLVPALALSADVKLSHNAAPDVARYLLNYMKNEGRYTEEWRNCQTFAADFAGFLSGIKHVEPVSGVNRVLYKKRHHWFLYDLTSDGDGDDVNDQQQKQKQQGKGGEEGSSGGTTKGDEKSPFLFNPGAAAGAAAAVAMAAAGSAASAAAAAGSVASAAATTTMGSLSRE